jgi:hypothetical protein
MNRVMIAIKFYNSIDRLYSPVNINGLVQVNPMVNGEYPAE